MDFILNSNLTLLNDGSVTHVTDNTGLTSVLDLSLVSPTLLPDTSWSTYDDSLGSDHFPISISYDVDLGEEAPLPRYDHRRADWETFSRVVNVNTQGHYINDKIHNLETSILQAADVAIPKTSPTPHKPGVLWWTPDCANALKERNRLFRIFNRQPSEINHVNFKKARAKARLTINNAKRNSWHRFVGTIQHNTPVGQVWDVVNRIRKKRTRSHIPRLKSQGRILDTARDIAELLGRTFQRNSSSANYDPRFLPTKAAREIEIYSFEEEGCNLWGYNSLLTMHELRTALQVANGKSPGPSGITYDMIKHLPHTQLLKVLEVFNEIWTTGRFPDSWHFAHVIPIPKRDRNREDPNSYRPIALTECLCKVMERIVKNRLTFYLESNNLLSDRQCGGRKHRSTVDHLVLLQEEINTAIATRKYLVASFLDIEKAFDMTWRSGVLKKLHAFGLRGRLPIFIQQFINDRTFAVKLNNIITDTFVQENGVPQGSVLAPVLFTVMINDFLPTAPQATNLKYSLFADDCAIWTTSSCQRVAVERVQIGLNQAQAWALKWGFKFSPHKCQNVIFTHRRVWDNLNLSLDGVRLEYSPVARFLGLKFDGRLTWKAHVKYLKQVAVPALNLLKHLTGTSWGADRKSLLMIYKSLVRSKFDYGSQAYGTATEHTLQPLTVLQNMCLRICTGALRCTRVSRLEVEAVVPPLQRRRDYLCLAYGYKLARLRQSQHPTWQRVCEYRTLEMRGATSFATKLHSICETSGVSPTDIDHLIAKNIPPWETLRSKIVTTWLPAGKKTPEEEARSRFYYFRQALQDCLHLYTDGSKSETHVGAGVWSPTMTGQYRLPNHVSVFTAELFAILKALEMATLSPQDRVVIFSDSMSALQAIQSETTTTNEIQGRIINNIYHFPKRLMLVWVPGHCGILGNERADRLARSASDLEEITLIPRDLKSCLTIGKATLHQQWQSDWDELQIPNKIKRHIHEWSTSSRLQRREEVALTRLRTHATRPTHLNAYMTHTFPPHCQTCQQTLTIEHILLSCSRYTQDRRSLRDLATNLGINFTTCDLLQDNEDIINGVLSFLRSNQILNHL